MGCLGGSGQTTDRKATLSGYGSLESVISQLSKTGSGLTSAGSSDTGRAAGYYSNILSGDPSKVMQAAAPQVDAIAAQADQQKKAIATGGNRTGGTNAVSQAIDSGARGQVADAIGKLRSGAASALGQIGAGETAAGIGATSGAGSTAASLSSISGNNRQTSQAIHQSAVNDWVQLASSILTSLPTGGGA